MDYKKNITILNANNRIDSSVYKTIEVTAVQAMEEVGRFFDISDIDVTFTSIYDEEIPSGIGGYSLSPFRVEILLDHKRKDLAAVIKQELVSVLAHEFHHCTRTKKH